jgi:hypothetical protein
MRNTIVLFAAILWHVVGACEVTALGGSSCGKWIANRNDDIRAQVEWKSKTEIKEMVPLFISQQNRALDRRWVMGFTSGAAAAMGVDLLASVDAESVVLWVDNYCELHPIDGVPLAAAMLVIELEKKAKKAPTKRP